MTSRTIAGVELTQDECEWTGMRPFPHFARLIPLAEHDESDPEGDAEIDEMVQEAAAGFEKMKAEIGLPDDFEKQFEKLAEKHGIFDDVEDEEDFDEDDEALNAIAELNRQGVFEVTVLTDEGKEPSPEQHGALEYLQQHEETICRNLLDAALRYYRNQREADQPWFEMSECPDISTSDELVRLMQFGGLVVQDVDLDGTALLGFDFSCDWDGEHGVGVCMHEDVVVEIGMEAAVDGPDGSDYGFTEVATPAEKERIQRVVEVIRACSGEADDYVPTDQQKLAWAVMQGDDATVKQLSQAGVSINDDPSPNDHPIFQAIEEMNAVAVRTMVDLGADLSVKNSERQTPLEAAEEPLKNMRFVEDMTGLLGDLGNQLMEQADGPLAYVKSAEEIHDILSRATQQ